MALCFQTMVKGRRIRLGRRWQTFFEVRMPEIEIFTKHNTHHAVCGAEKSKEEYSMLGTQTHPIHE
jgi:hypothetical protein